MHIKYKGRILVVAFPYDFAPVAYREKRERIHIEGIGSGEFLRTLAAGLALAALLVWPSCQKFLVHCNFTITLHDDKRIIVIARGRFLYKLVDMRLTCARSAQGAAAYSDQVKRVAVFVQKRYGGFRFVHGSLWFSIRQRMDCRIPRNDHISDRLCSSVPILGMYRTIFSSHCRVWFLVCGDGQTRTAVSAFPSSGLENASITFRPHVFIQYTAWFLECQGVKVSIRKLHIPLKICSRPPLPRKTRARFQ